MLNEVPIFRGQQFWAPDYLTLVSHGPEARLAFARLYSGDQLGATADVVYVWTRLAEVPRGPEGSIGTSWRRRIVPWKMWFLKQFSLILRAQLSSRPDP